MGRKIPMWQCILVMVVMIVLIFWNVMIDTDAGEAHVALVLAGAFAAIIAFWQWFYAWLVSSQCSMDGNGTTWKQAFWLLSTEPCRQF